MSCADSIAFLRLLHKVPHPRSANPTPRALDSTLGHYVLPLETERNIASSLAFLSSLKSDSERIPALCLEENRELGRIDVLVAVNSQSGYGSQTLGEIKNGLEMIFGVVNRAIEAGSDEEIFSAIVTVCHQRILERLRLVTTNKDRQQVKELLQMSTKAIQISTEPICPPYTEMAKELIAAIDAWKGHQINTRLQTVVEKVHRMSRLSGLGNLIESLPNVLLAPTARQNLLNIIGKVARYREAARVLYRTAKKFPLARNLTVRMITLPKAMFAPSLSVQAPTLASALTKMRGGNADRPTKSSKTTVSQICRLICKTEKEASVDFMLYRDAALSRGKIHAEVQLVYYCDSQHASPPPRVICSSKDACLLCNEFILSHGKFHTPKCHGRLYPGWKLPISTVASTAERALVRRLELQVQESIRVLLERQTRTIYPDPNESTLLTIPRSASTLVLLSKRTSVLSSDSEIDTSEPQAVLEEPTSLDSHDREESRSGIFTTELACVKENIPYLPTTATTKSRLTCGASLVTVLKANQSTELYEAGPLRVQCEYSIGNGGPQGGGDRDTAHLVCSLTWIGDDEAAGVRQDQKLKIINAYDIEGEVSLDPRDLDGLYISAGQTLLKVQVS